MVLLVQQPGVQTISSSKSTFGPFSFSRFGNQVSSWRQKVIDHLFFLGSPFMIYLGPCLDQLSRGNPNRGGCLLFSEPRLGCQNRRQDSSVCSSPNEPESQERPDICTWRSGCGATNHGRLQGCVFDVGNHKIRVFPSGVPLKPQTMMRKLQNWTTNQQNLSQRTTNHGSPCKPRMPGRIPFLSLWERSKRTGLKRAN